MGNLIPKLKHKNATDTTWQTQSGEFMTTEVVNVDLCVPEFSVKKTVTWKYHMDGSAEGMHGIIIGEYLLTSLDLDIDFYKYVIVGCDGT